MWAVLRYLSICSSPKRPYQLWGPPCLLFTTYFPRPRSLQDEKLTNHFEPMPRLRIKETILQLPHTPLWLAKVHDISYGHLLLRRQSKCAATLVLALLCLFLRLYQSECSWADYCGVHILGITIYRHLSDLVKIGQTSWRPTHNARNMSLTRWIFNETKNSSNTKKNLAQHENRIRFLWQIPRFST